jgi:quinolinate synthase
MNILQGLIEKIEELKEEALILAHNYQHSGGQDVVGYADDNVDLTWRAMRGGS